MRIKMGPEGTSVTESSRRVFIPRDAEVTLLIGSDGRYVITVGEDVEPPIGSTVMDMSGKMWTRRENGMWSIGDTEGWQPYHEIDRRS